MPITDGDKFRGLDEDVYAADEPLDVLAIHTIAGNIRRLQALDSVCFTYYSDDTDDTGAGIATKTYKSVVGAGTVLFIPWRLSRGQDGVEFEWCYRSDSDGAGSPEIWYQYRLHGPDLTVMHSQVGSLDVSASTSWQVFQETFSFDAPWTGDELWGALSIAIRSETDGATGTTFNIDKIFGAAVRTQNIGDYRVYAEGQTQVLRTDDGDVTMDVFGMQPDNSGPDRLLLYPGYSADSNAELQGVEAYYVSYLQLRAFWVRPTYDAQALISLRSGDARAKSPIGAQGLELALGLDDYARRYRPVACGPGGEYIEPAGEPDNWPAGTAKVWPTVFGDGGATDFIHHDLRVEESGHTLVCLCYVIVTQLDEGTFMPAGIVTTAMTEGAQGTSKWTFQLSLQQLDDGDTLWSSADGGQVDRDIDIPVHPVSPLMDSRFIRTRWVLHRFGDLYGLDPQILAFAPHEGMLYPEDHQLIYPVVLKLPGSSLSAVDYSNPMALVVSAEYQSHEVPWAETSNGGTTTLALTCVGWSAWVTHE